ncbi:MAG: hypothetical protein GY950_08370, partial [bacterium]|nr:hypothetical protein [bacterium]
PDGSIQYSGRIDHQVQLRGFRIEMGEIESQLLRHENIKEAVVTCREKGGDKHLCAYIVPGGTAPAGHPYSGARRMEHGEVKQFLSQTLPDYMIPSFFVFLEKIPLTANGKVDGKALPEPEIVPDKGGYTAPRNEVEKKLAAIWAEILGIELKRVGIDSGFFELGGHSIKATLLASRIHKVFNVKISVTEIFTAPTIRGLAQSVAKAGEDKYTVIQPVEKREYYP